jgi:hypothetical protein
MEIKMGILSWILIFVFGWLLIAQLGMGIQELDVVRDRRKAQ